MTGCVAPGSDTGNSANCSGRVLTNVGAYGLSDSPNGTFDQGGNVWEWNEADIFGDGSSRGVRGGAWSYYSESLLASNSNLGGSPTYGYHYVGFRVSSVPEPGSISLCLAMAIAGLLCWRRWR